MGVALGTVSRKLNSGQWRCRSAARWSAVRSPVGTASPPFLRRPHPRSSGPHSAPEEQPLLPHPPLRESAYGDVGHTPSQLCVQAAAGSLSVCPARMAPPTAYSHGAPLPTAASNPCSLSAAVPAPAPTAASLLASIRARVVTPLLSLLAAQSLFERPAISLAVMQSSL